MISEIDQQVGNSLPENNVGPKLRLIRLRIARVQSRLETLYTVYSLDPNKSSTDLLTALTGAEAEFARCVQGYGRKLNISAREWGWPPAKDVNFSKLGATCAVLFLRSRLEVLSFEEQHVVALDPRFTMAPTTRVAVEQNPASAASPT